MYQATLEIECAYLVSKLPATTILSNTCTWGKGTSARVFGHENCNCQYVFFSIHDIIWQVNEPTWKLVVCKQLL